MAAAAAAAAAAEVEDTEEEKTTLDFATRTNTKTCKMTIVSGLVTVTRRTAVVGAGTRGGVTAAAATVKVDAEEEVGEPPSSSSSTVTRGESHVHTD